MARGVVIYDHDSLAIDNSGNIVFECSVLGVPDVGSPKTVQTNISLIPTDTLGQWATSIRDQARIALIDHAGIDISTTVIRIPAFN